MLQKNMNKLYQEQVRVIKKCIYQESREKRFKLFTELTRSSKRKNLSQEEYLEHIIRTRNITDQIFIQDLKEALKEFQEITSKKIIKDIIMPHQELKTFLTPIQEVNGS